MGLAELAVARNQFESMHDHLDTHSLAGGTYRNMHMREAIGPTGKRRLSYFHVMFAPKGDRRIQGMISGPLVFCSYEMSQLPSGRVRMVAQEDGDEVLRERIASKFLHDVFKKIEQDRKRNTYPPNRTIGQLYLKRRMGGVDPDHVICREAVRQHVLDEDFVDVLAPWNLQLYRY